MKSLILISATLATLFLATGCSSKTPYSEILVKSGKSEASVYQYSITMAEVQWQLSKNQNFKPLPVSNNEDMNWYADLTYKIWNNEIEKEDFIAQAVEYKKGYRESFELIADSIIENKYVK